MDKIEDENMEIIVKRRMIQDLGKVKMKKMTEKKEKFLSDGLAAIALKLDVMLENISIHGRFITAVSNTVKCDLF